MKVYFRLAKLFEMNKILFLLVLFYNGFTFAQSTEKLAYSVDGKPFLGFVAKPAKITKKTKTILIVHEWWGLNEYPKSRAEQLAKEGFIAICLDMYGENIVVNTPPEAMKLSGEIYADPSLLYKRFDAGYQAAMGVKGVNKNLVAAIGYCFGGNVVLNAAKQGANLDAVISFHGGLKGAPLEKGKLKAAVLVCNGAADKFVPQSEIDEFNKQMKENNADYTFINYADATHAFTNPNSTEVGKKFSLPIAYNEAADKKSYADFLRFVAKKVK